MIRHLTRLITGFIRPYWRHLVLVILLQTVATAMGLYLPTLNARIIDEGVITGDTAYIWRTGGLMLVLALIQSAAQITAIWFAAGAAMGFGRDIRAAVFHHTLGFSAREMQHFGAASLLTRNTNDARQVQMLVLMTFTMLIGAPITMVGGFIMALREDPGLSWVILAAVLLLGVGIALLVVSMGNLFKKMQERVDAINRILREQITGIRVVRAFVQEDHESRRFDRVNTDLHDVTLDEGTLGPATAGDDPLADGDGDAVRCQAQLRDERGGLGAATDEGLGAQFHGTGGELDGVQRPADSIRRLQDRDPRARQVAGQLIGGGQPAEPAAHHDDAGAHR